MQARASQTSARAQVGSRSEPPGEGSWLSARSAARLEARWDGLLPDIYSAMTCWWQQLVHAGCPTLRAFRRVGILIFTFPIWPPQAVQKSRVAHAMRFSLRTW